MERRDYSQIIDALTPTLQQVIKETVNGKIDKLTEKFEDHICKVDAHIEKSETHIEQMKPIIERVEQLTTVGDTVKWLDFAKNSASYMAGFITPILIIGGFILAIIKFIR